MVYLKFQERLSTCGLACLRNALRLSCDVRISERSLRMISQYLYTREGKKDIVTRDGIGPWCFARLVKEELTDRIEMGDLNVFTTSNGTIEQLGDLISEGVYPIIHRKFHEGNGGNHYELVLGIKDKKVYLHNPADWVETAGVHSKPEDLFYRRWWDFNGEKWFMAIYPSYLSLPKERFRGRNI